MLAAFEADGLNAPERWLSCGARPEARFMSHGLTRLVLTAAAATTEGRTLALSDNSFSESA